MTTQKVVCISLSLGLALSSFGQLKVVPSGSVSVGGNTPTEQFEVARGNAFLSAKTPKLYFENRERYLGIPGLGADGQVQSDLTLISKNRNWLRIGTRAGIAFYGGQEDNNGYHDGERNSDLDHMMFIDRQGVGVGTNCVAQAPYVLKVHGDGLIDGLWYNSDVRFKKNIEVIDSPLEKILRIKGVTFDYRTDEFPGHHFSKNRTIGFIAQELKDILPEVVQLGSDGYYGVNYTALVPVLVEAVKAQQAQIDQLTKNLENCGSWPKATAPASVLRSQGARLDQNRPNPSNGNAAISLSIPSSVTNATLEVYDLRGELIRSFPVPSRSESIVMIDAGSFQAGIYLYGLILDGELFEVKQMVLTN